MAANVLISALEVFSVFTESNENIKGRKSFKHIFLYTAFADDFALFLRAIPSVKELINSFHKFYCFSGLKANAEKCETTGIDSLKGIEPVCGLKYTDLSFDTVKKLGINFSYNKNFQMQNNFLTTIKKYSKFFVYSRIHNFFS